MIHKLIIILKRYNELWLGPIGFALYFIFSHLVQSIDPQSVPYTLDAVQKVLFGHLVFSVCTFSTWLCLRLTWPSLFRFLVDEFNNHFKQLPSCEKLKLSFLVFACYLLGLLLAMQVL